MILLSSRPSWYGWAALAAGIAFLSPSGALGQAQTRVCDPEESQACSQPLQKGEVAPFSGQLVTTVLAIRLGQKAERCEAQLGLERGYAEKILAIERELGAEKLKIEQETRIKERDFLFAEIEKAKLVHWYERPLFILTATFILTSVIMSGIYFSAK